MTSSGEALSKPKLIPVKVPWKIAVSTPFLTLTVNEFEPAQVEFLAQFNPYSEDIEDERVVTATFTGVWHYRGSSALDEGQSPIDESLYAWSAVKLKDLPVFDAKSLNDWARNFSKEWKATGLCPDPGMYEVHNSDWTSLAQSEEGDYTHFLIVGEARCVEILSMTWSWEARDKKDLSSE